MLFLLLLVGSLIVCASYVLADMHMSAVTARLKAVLERDLYAMAKEVLDRRLAGEEEGPVSTHINPQHHRPRL